MSQRKIAKVDFIGTVKSGSSVPGVMGKQGSVSPKNAKLSFDSANIGVLVEYPSPSNLTILVPFSQCASIELFPEEAPPTHAPAKK